MVAMGALSAGPARSQLLLHGAVVLWAGLLSGFGFWSAIVGRKGEALVRAWRVAHATLLMDALLMLVVALALPYLALSRAAARVLTWALVLSAYGFVFALGLGALAGVRGLSPRPWGRDTVFFAGHVLGATGALVAAALLLYGAAMALRSPV